MVLQKNSDPHNWKRQFCSKSVAWHQNDLSNLSYLTGNELIQMTEHRYTRKDVAKILLLWDQSILPS